MTRRIFTLRACRRQDLTRYPLLLALLLITFTAGDAFASANGMSNAMCSIPLAVVNTSIGRAIATLGIIILGVMATLGRVTWTQAVVVGVGISVIFGAASIAAMLAMNQGQAC